MYFSWDYGNVHFVSYSTETSYPNSPFSPQDFGDQIDWLISDLRTANEPQNRAVRPWIVVAGHRPIYSSDDSKITKQGWYKSFRFFTQWYTNQQQERQCSLVTTDIWEHLFWEPSWPHSQCTIFLTQWAGNDWVTQGHVHSYERNYPTYQSNVMSGYSVPKAPFNIVIGNGGVIFEYFWSQSLISFN